MKFKVGDTVRIKDPYHRMSGHFAVVEEVVGSEGYLVVKIDYERTLSLIHKDKLESLKEEKEMRPTQELIDEVMDWFNFDRVAKVMDALNWKWAGAEYRGDGVPIEAEIRSKARELLQDTIKKGGGISSGGFEASYKEGVLTLKFVVAEWDTSYA